MFPSLPSFRFRACAFLLVPLGLALGEARPCWAAKAHAATGRFWVKPAAADSNSVWFGTLGWATTATIKWRADLTADGVNTVLAPDPEPKFNVPAIGLPTARVWTNFLPNWDPPPPGGSRANGQGSGKSTVGPVFYGADWEVLAGGLLGAQAGAMYDSVVEGNDPWNLYPAELSSIPDATYSLYVPLSLLAGESLANTGGVSSGYAFNVSYETTAGTTKLLDIVVEGDTGNAKLASAFGSNISLVQQSADQVTPDGLKQLPGAPLSESALNALLLTDLTNLRLDSPLYLGVLLSGIEKPTQTLADGAVARIHIGSQAFESVPEPATLVLALCAGLGAAVASRCRRRRSPSPPLGPPS